ncbi:hypothetical protein LBGG_01233 [Lactobacillus gasseri MV-22]|nr:hypothetical protein LBGG_01233 [Lactobacillus gasseri MV-22]
MNYIHLERNIFLLKGSIFMEKTNEKKQFVKVNGLKVETVDYDDNVELLVSCSGCQDEDDVSEGQF